MTVSNTRDANICRLAMIVACDRAKRWGYNEQHPEELASWVRREAGDRNLLLDITALLCDARADTEVTPIADQPPPVANDAPHIADLVLADVAARKRVGVERYGVALQAHNGRDALVDTYQEAMDLVMYIRQAIEERKG